MDYYKVKDHHEWRRFPFVMNRTEIHIHSLHCNTCQTSISDMVLVATEEHQVTFHDARGNNE